MIQKFKTKSYEKVRSNTSSILGQGRKLLMIPLSHCLKDTFVANWTYRISCIRSLSLFIMCVNQSATKWKTPSTYASWKAEESGSSWFIRYNRKVRFQKLITDASKTWQIYRCETKCVNKDRFHFVLIKLRN